MAINFTYHPPPVVWLIVSSLTPNPTAAMNKKEVNKSTVNKTCCCCCCCCSPEGSKPHTPQSCRLVQEGTTDGREQRAFCLQP
ncbi:hypothetical protein INR49_001860 [Caranx melampygus]|nr:hypothetical protein INR49_001860 [Caranx melampygus]